MKEVGKTLSQIQSDYKDELKHQQNIWNKIWKIEVKKAMEGLPYNKEISDRAYEEMFNCMSEIIMYSDDKEISKYKDMINKYIEEHYFTDYHYDYINKRRCKK